MTGAAVDPVVLARHLGDRLAHVPGIVAVVLGGSVATETHDEHSDVDLALYYEPARPIDLAALEALARELDDRHESGLVTPLGEWGPWINGGGWLTVGGRRVDWLYRDLARVRSVVGGCLEGRTQAHYQPGHPHAFHEHIYLGEVREAVPLRDDARAVAMLKDTVRIYPPALRATIVERYLWEAGFSLATAEKAAFRGDVTYVTGCAFRAVACLVQVLFAVNERSFLNEKGAVAAVERMPVRPERFQARIEVALAGLATDAQALAGALDRLAQITYEVRVLSAR